MYRGPDDQSVLVWELRWDSSEDVTEAVTGFRSWLPARTGAALQDLGPGTEWRSSGDRGSAWLRRFGDSVFVVIGDDAAAVERVGQGLP